MKNEHRQFLEHGKLPPQCVEIEEAVLGSILISKDAIVLVADILSIESFYKETNQKIYAAALELYNQSKSIDLLTVINQLKKNEHLDLVGGAYSISQLTNSVASAANVEEHARIVKQYHIKREIIRFSSEVITMAYSDNSDALELSEMVLNNAYELNTYDSVAIQSNADLIREVAKQVENAKKNKGLTGVPTGLIEVDKTFGGYQKSDLIIKAARPAMGKTAQALCEAIYMSYVANLNVAFFSLEMSSVQLMKRIISIETEINSEKLRSGELTEYDWKQFTGKTTSLMSDNLKIYDRCYTINSIVKECKKLALKGTLDAIYIDYIQLITAQTKQNSNREQEVSLISRRLKMLAKELNVPVIALCQLSRAVEQRGGRKVPMLSDLRESGSIEQDADIVQFLYRPEYYGITENEDGSSTRGLAQMVVAKHRNGACKEIDLSFIGSLTKFTNYEQQEISNSFPTQIKPNADF